MDKITHRTQHEPVQFMAALLFSSQIVGRERERIVTAVYVSV